jgi:hypothetical protein
MSKATIDDKDIVFYGTFILEDIHRISTLIRCNARLILLADTEEQVFEVHRHRSSDAIIELFRHTNTDTKEEHVATLLLLDGQWQMRLQQFGEVA